MVSRKYLILSSMLVAKSYTKCIHKYVNMVLIIPVDRAALVGLLVRVLYMFLSSERLGEV